MRKVLPILPIVIVLFVAMTSSLTAESIVSIPDDIPGVTGEVAMAPVEIDDATGVLSFGFDITYDTALLDLSDTDVKSGSLTSSGWFFVTNIIGGGLAKVGGYSTIPLTGGSGSLLEIDFHVAGSSGTSVLGISGTLSDLNGYTIPATYDSGSIDIVPEPSIIASLLGLLVAAGFVFKKRR